MIQLHNHRFKFVRISRLFRSHVLDTTLHYSCISPSFCVHHFILDPILTAYGGRTATEGIVTGLGGETVMDMGV